MEDWSDQDGHVLLETAISRMDETSLELVYRVTNELEHTILLMTPLPRVELDTTRPAPERVYSYLDPDGILQLTKRFWPLPEEIDVVFPEVPFVTELKAGQSFEERLVLTLPIRVEIPYDLNIEELDKKPEEIAAVAGGIAFSIGYLISREVPLRNRPTSIESGGGPMLNYGVASENQQILQGGTLEIGIPVRGIKR